MSAILSADDLNDFITPGVACIKPIEILPAEPSTTATTSHQQHSTTDPSSSLEHEVILDGTPGAASVVGGSNSTNKAAQISLTDCLACSGCVTSAEAVLVSLQSHTEVLSVLDAAPAIIITRKEEIDSTFTGTSPLRGETITASGLLNPDSKILVASLAPQVLASLAAVLGVSTTKVSHMLTRFLTETLSQGGKHNNGFAYVVSTEPANDLSLHLSAQEVLSPSPTKPTSFNNGSPAESKPAGSSIVIEGAQKPPILASACPGWVCYAEKTHPYVLPHLSRVKSPQALTGVLVKSVLSQKLGVSPDRIWHLAIMPCFDKKLEAAREELTSLSWWDGHRMHEHKGFRDVDCVITSKEIFLLAEERGVEFFSVPSTPVPESVLAPFPDEEVAKFLFTRKKGGKRKHIKEAGSSGGILHHILHRSAAQHRGSKIQTTHGRNKDVVEYAVITESGEIVFKAARYYGFRNIQNLVRRLKPAKQSRLPGGKSSGSGARRPAGKAGTSAVKKNARLEHAYVEVMACPGGCTNGGGQVKVDDNVVVERHDFLGDNPGVQEQKVWLNMVDEAYFSGAGEQEERENGNGNDPSTTEEEATDERRDLVDGISVSYVQGLLDHWAKSVGADLDRMVHTSFREVVSDVGKEVNETERVIQLAGKVGGGW
ncbi:Cytosolic Fe-S cluster assembly factor NAR1 [Zalerion maritima]|uniref:Cytosolic Fe-S cluster assembly factor NAR1 n=1 Tax=Zalerion maritima TaxID=339359 RepID=A0AAD5WV58_9PEZI|nr:Cytosolic Fe-S cluster assembly factor NAR1 [Zalerion maritima]